VTEVLKDKTHAALMQMTGGQLRFPGLMPLFLTTIAQETFDA
jgi:hypothetical protein